MANPSQPHAAPIRRLYDLAFGRSGDKGAIANVSVIARSPAAYAEIKERVTAERVKAHLGPLVRGRVERFELDTIGALNFVLYNALDGGATRSLRLDGLGKSLAGAVLYMPLDTMPKDANEGTPTKGRQRRDANEGRWNMTHEIIAPWGELVPDEPPMTADEFFAMGERNRWLELVNGVLVRMAPTGFRHGKPLIRLSSALFRYVDMRSLGEVTPAEEGFILSQPGLPDTVLAPDIAFIRAEQLPAVGTPGIEKFLRLAPDLVVEVASPDQYKPEMAAKAKLYLSSGVRLVWVVWPVSQTVDIWLPGQAAPERTLTVLDTLDGLDVLPGFSYPLATLFAG